MLSVASTRTGPKSSAIITAPGEKCGLADRNAPHGDDAISEFRGEFMLMTPDWKMALNRDGRTYLLFDRNADPQEGRNLAGLPACKAIEDELRLRMLERIAITQLKSP